MIHPSRLLLITASGILLAALAHQVAKPFRNPSQSLLADPPFSRLGPRHLALVINSADPLSERIGLHYIRVRSIPADQVIRVSFPPGNANLSPARFLAIRRYVLARTPAHVQVYALVWAAPYRVGCQSITSAFSFGLDPAWCAQGCRATKLNPLHARGDVRRPWNELRFRPSMMLAATTYEHGVQLIDRGVASDGQAPGGTAYFLSTSDPARNVRAAGYGHIRQAFGSHFRIRILKQDRLQPVKDVMFYFTGLANVAGLDRLRFRPGAVADHLTSLGGQLTDSPQMSSLRWLEAGATGSYGTVVEPCNLRAKFPDPGLILTYYLRGDTLIESYWKSVAMPGQGVFIGEPLARPWHPQSAQSSHRQVAGLLNTKQLPGPESMKTEVPER
jgi:uncharacterized protein (TIGR03790 family)